MREVNVQAIMAEIRKEIQEKKNIKKVSSFDEFCTNRLFKDDELLLEKLENNLQYMNNFKEIQTFRPYQSSSLLGKLKVLFQKIVRRCICFYVQPMILEQNDLNVKNYEILEQLVALEKLNEQRILALKNRICELEQDGEKN